MIQVSLNHSLSFFHVSCHAGQEGFSNRWIVTACGRLRGCWWQGEDSYSPYTLNVCEATKKGKTMRDKLCWLAELVSNPHNYTHFKRTVHLINKNTHFFFTYLLALLIHLDRFDVSFQGLWDISCKYRCLTSNIMEVDCTWLVVNHDPGNRTDVVKQVQVRAIVISNDRRRHASTHGRETG